MIEDRTDGQKSHEHESVRDLRQAPAAEVILGKAAVLLARMPRLPTATARHRRGDQGALALVDSHSGAHVKRSREREAKRWLPTDSEAWKRLRQFVLAREPLCRMCGQVATEVDHINGRADRREDNAHENLQALCKPCHSRKTRSQVTGSPMRGCDADGTPLGYRSKRP